MTYSVCWEANDPEHWIEVEAFDAEQAAESGAASFCERDNECYSAFEHGEVVVVRTDGADDAHFDVTVEFVPDFTARRWPGE